MADVFISYSSKDAASAEYLLKTLESMYLTCWMAPRDIPKAENFADMIPSAIRNAKAFLILVSQDSQDSPQVLNELTFASHVGLPRIAICLDRTAFNNSFNYHIAIENRYEGFGRLAAASSEVVKRIHLEIEKQQRDKEARQQKKDMTMVIPMVWILSIAACAAILVCVCSICLLLNVITLPAFLQATSTIGVLAILAASLVQTSLFNANNTFYKKFVMLIELLTRKPKENE